MPRPPGFRSASKTCLDSSITAKGSSHPQFANFDEPREFAILNETEMLKKRNRMHGSNLSRLALGDLAGFSDIYGYNTIRLGEVFLEQSFF